MQDMDSIRPFSRTWNIKVSVTFDSNNKLDDEFTTKLVLLHCKSIFYLSIRFKAFADPFKAFLFCNDIYIITVRKRARIQKDILKNIWLIYSPWFPNSLSAASLWQRYQKL